jgi:hypothetical protein
MGSKIPTALMPFTPPATAYEVWIDGQPNVNFDTGAHHYIAVGLTNSAATANNFETVGQAWLSLACVDLCRGGKLFELRLNGRTGPLLASVTASSSNKLSQLLLRYDPVAKVLSASADGTSLGNFPLDMVAPS